MVSALYLAHPSLPDYEVHCIYLHMSDESELERRLSERVDKMVTDGLEAEVNRLFDLLSKVGPLDPSKGVTQSIGLQEFIEYYRNPSKEAFEAGVEQVKINSIRYAKLQAKMIETRLCKLTSFVSLDTSDLSQWPQISAKSLECVRRFLRDEPLPETVVVVPKKQPKLQTQWQKYKCEVCNKVVNGENEWKVHLTSRPHKKRLAKKRKIERQEVEPKKEVTQPKPTDPNQTEMGQPTDASEPTTGSGNEE